MKEENNAAGGTQGARRASEVEPAAAGPVLRWSARRKQEAVLRLLRGEPLDAVSRAMGVESYRLEEWRSRAVAGMEAALRERGDDDPAAAHLREAQRVIGEMAMQNDLLRDRKKKRTGDHGGCGDKKPGDIPRHREALRRGACLRGMGCAPLVLLWATGVRTFWEGCAGAAAARPEAGGQR